MRNLIWTRALTPLLAAAPASACKIIRHPSSGEELCVTASDSGGQSYTDGRSAREKAIEGWREHTLIERAKRHPPRDAGRPY